MTIRHMKIFTAVYQCRNITQAAKRLHMTQPAVTRAIQELERYYGVRLFERTNRRLTVTPCGERMVGHALHIVETFDTLERELRNWDEIGVLRVGASVTLGNFLLPQAVERFEKLHPQIRVKAKISNREQLQQALLVNQLDLALVEGGATQEYLHTQCLARDRLVLVLPVGHPLEHQEPLRLGDLTNYPILLREEGSAGRDFLEHAFAVRGLTLDPAWESASTEALIRGVERGLGITLLPWQLVWEKQRQGTVVTRRVSDAQLERRHDLVWHKNKFLTSSARDFIRLCQDLSQEKMIRPGEWGAPLENPGER